MSSLSSYNPELPLQETLLWQGSFLDFWGVEQEKCPVEGDDVVFRKGWLAVVVGDNFDDEGEEADEEGTDNESAKCPDEDLATNNDATHIYVPFLLHFMFSFAQEPAMLGLIQSTSVQLMEIWWRSLWCESPASLPTDPYCAYSFSIPYDKHKIQILLVSTTY